MKPETKKQVVIKGLSYNLDETQNKVFYNNHWRQLIEDQEGEYYFFYADTTIYLDKHEATAPTSKEQLPEEEVLPKVTIEDNDGDWCVYDESGHLVYDGFETKEQAESYASEDGYEPVSEEEMKAFNKAKKQLPVVKRVVIEHWDEDNSYSLFDESGGAVENDFKSYEEAETYAKDNDYLVVESFNFSAPVVEGEKFTGGEWRIDDSNSGSDYDFNNIHIVTDNSTICNIPSNALSIHQECKDEAKANAKLIAAAPAMYRALKEFEQLLLDGDPQKLTDHYLNVCKPLLNL